MKTREEIQLGMGQEWLNTYCSTISNYTPIPTTGETSTISQTIIAALLALQKNIGVSTDAIETEFTNDSFVFGPETIMAFGDFELSVLTDFNIGFNENMLKILQIGLWCKGIDPGDFGAFTVTTTNAINTLGTWAGVNLNGNAPLMVFRALTTEVAFQLTPQYDGVQKIREMQMFINSKYAYERQFLMPTDGVKSIDSLKGLVYLYQRLIGISASEANAAKGKFGMETFEKSPTVTGTNVNEEIIYALQYGLYFSNGFDIDITGVFDANTIAAVFSLQGLMGIPVTGDVDPVTWGYVFTSSGYNEISVKGADCADHLSPQYIEYLKQSGYTHVGRYLTGKFQMSQNEIQNIINGGLAVIPLFEFGADLSYFNYNQGTIDAQAAVLAAINLNIPEEQGITIYFAVDNDFLNDDINGPITNYFQGIYEQFEQVQYGFKIGVYGARYTCQQILNAGYATTAYVDSASFEYTGNVGVGMPQLWAFNQINDTAPELPNGLSIDHVKISGRDQGVTRLTNGIHINISGNLGEQSYLTQINEDFDPYTKSFATDLLSIILSGNFKSPNILDLWKTTREGLSIDEPIYLSGDNFYIKLAAGLKAQANSGSDFTCYLDYKRTEDGVPMFGLSKPTIDWLPSFGSPKAVTPGLNFDTTTIGKKIINFMPISTVDISSLIPGQNILLDDILNNIGLEFYPVWNMNEDAEPGYFETGVELGMNTPNIEFLAQKYGANIPGLDTLGEISKVSSLYFYVDIILGIKINSLDNLKNKLGQGLSKAVEFTNSFKINLLVEMIKEIHNSEYTININPETSNPEVGELVIEWQQLEPQLVNFWDNAGEALENLAEFLGNFLFKIDRASLPIE